MAVKAQKQVFKCNVCGNIVEVLHLGGGILVCCNQEMQLLEENTVDAAKEKHVPVIEKDGDKVLVKVGSVAHPMEQEHYIEFIELITDDCVHIHYLKPGEEPKAVFEVPCSETYFAREYCNKHGLWKS
jgi:superoxide reductase